MGVRRIGTRRARRDRGDGGAAVGAPTPAAARYHYGAGAGVAPAPRDGKTAVRFSWAGGAARNIALVASFDGFMHHRMTRIALGQRAGPATFEVTLRIPPGSYTFKFLVDGVWRVDRASAHGVERSPDGMLQHRLAVAASPQSAPEPTPALRNALDLAGGAAPVYAVRRTPVIRSSSVSDLHSSSAGELGAPAQAAMADRRGFADAASARSFASLDASVPNLPSHGTMSRGALDRHDRPSSFMAMSGSSPGAAHRKSLIPRFGGGWMRRFSGRHHSNVNEELRARDGGIAAPLSAGAPAQSAPMFPGADKENAGVMGNSALLARGTPERKRRGGALRASGRATAVTVSGPTRVDEPKDMAEVHRDADEWRGMARELQDNLNDSAGARELLSKAIRHREKHNLWCTIENGQTHVDLARSLSKADRFADAEFHLRIALKIYRRIDAGPEHIGDLLHYIGVVVDRQKKRADAEALYRSALDTYRAHRVVGNNVEIALKNLALNLRKQGREPEAAVFVREYYSSARA